MKHHGNKTGVPVSSIADAGEDIEGDVEMPADHRL